MRGEFVAVLSGKTSRRGWLGGRRAGNCSRLHCWCTGSSWPCSPAKSSGAICDFDFGENVIPRGADGGEAGLGSHRSASVGVGSEGKCLREEDVVGGGDEPGFAVADDEFWAAGGGNHRGDAGGESFENYITEGIGSGRKHKDVEIGVGAGKRLSTKDAGELGMLEILGQLFTLCAVANDADFEIGDCMSQQIAFDFGQKVDVLLDRESPDATDPKGCTGMGSFRGIKKHRVNAASHEKTGAARSALDKFEKLGVGGHDDGSEPVEGTEGLQSGHGDAASS